MFLLKLGWVGSALCILFLACLWLKRKTLKGSYSGILPPTARCRIPYSDHFLAFALGGHRLFSMLRPHCGERAPIRFNLFGFSIFLISSPQTIRKTTYNPHTFSDNNIRARFVTNVFGVPQKAADVLKADTSGSARQPLAGSNVPPERRIVRMQQESTFDLLTSKEGIDEFLFRFTGFTEKLVTASGIGEQWVELPDFFYFMRKLASTAVINSLCGPRLLEKSPNFVDSFWIFDANIHYLHIGVPQFIKRDAYKARNECLDSIKKWKRAAIENSKCKTYPDSLLWDEIWGLKVMRERNGMYDRFSEFDDETARAGADLGILWACNDNLIPAACWFIQAILSSPSLHTRCMASINQARLPSQPGDVLPRFDLDILSRQPLLKSVYHEVLRTQITSFIARTVEQDYRMGEYLLPKGSITLTIPWLENHNPEKWETRPGAEQHPVEEFWPERFLVYPSSADKAEIHRRQNIAADEGSEPPISSKNHVHTADPEPEFSLRGLEGTFIPFGTGHHVCPGRQFATPAILNMAAMLISAFDFEPIGVKGWTGQGIDYSTFGYTPFRPAKKMPFRIRRKSPTGDEGGCR